jgi:hypothetical protein
MNAVPFAEFKKTKRTTQNPINKSGKSGEVLLEKTLISKFPDLPYRRTKSGKRGIDFILNPDGKPQDRMYIDMKYQHSSGGRDLAVGATAWKYHEDYDYKECYIVEGSYDFTDDIKELAKTLDEVCGIKTYFVKLDEMIDIIRKKYYGENSKSILTARKFF